MDAWLKGAYTDDTSQNKGTGSIQQKRAAGGSSTLIPQEYKKKSHFFLDGGGGLHTCRHAYSFHALIMLYESRCSSFFFDSFISPCVATDT
jgi:hypothetical protein